MDSLLLIQQGWTDGWKNLSSTVLLGEHINGRGQREKTGNSCMLKWISDSSCKCSNEDLRACLTDVRVELVQFMHGKIQLTP